MVRVDAEAPVPGQDRDRLCRPDHSARSARSATRARADQARQAVSVYSGGAQALARQNLTIVGQSYELGRVTVFDVLAEQRRYLDVERAYTEALRAAYEARTALNRALGGVR